MDRRVWLALSLVGGVGFWWGGTALQPGVLPALFKMTGVAALAAYAMAGGVRPMALVMALGALGDGLIEWRLAAGALAFLAGHGVAIRFYARALRAHTARDRFDAAVIALAILLGALVFSDFSPGVDIYAAGLATMAATAWLSRFRRDRTGAGALMFAVSDLLIFARMGHFAGGAVPGLLIWPLYYFGQVLIAVGVVEADRDEQIRAA